MARPSFPFLLLSFIAAFVGTYNIATSLLSSSIATLEDSYAFQLAHPSDGSSSSINDEDLLLSSSSSSSSSVSLSPADPSTAITSRPERLKPKRQREVAQFRTAMTCDSSGYSKWQSRVMFFYYKKWQASPGGEEMGPFTRVLHTGEEDELMEEIPTFIVDPLPEGMDQGYIVLNRPWAFVQWIEKHKFPEKYVWMAEPDHIIVRPIPNLAARSRMPAAFPFFYITPQNCEKILRKWFPEERGPISLIDPIGNSPVIIEKETLRQIVPLWHNVTLQMKNDPEADKEFGWVLEMYGYATAAAMVGVRHALQRQFMIQPPYDESASETYIIHYTYGCDYNLRGEATTGKVGEWHFDKRDYEVSPPRNLTMPPKGTSPSVVLLMSMINDATYSIPGWKAGVE